MFQQISFHWKIFYFTIIMLFKIIENISDIDKIITYYFFIQYYNFYRPFII